MQLQRRLGGAACGAPPAAAATAAAAAMPAQRRRLGSVPSPSPLLQTRRRQRRALLIVAPHSRSSGGGGAHHHHDHDHDHDHDHHDHDHGHDHHHDHDHDHGKAAKARASPSCCGSHHHHHSHADAEASPLLRPLARLGVFRLAEELESRTGYSVAAGVALLLAVALRAWAASAPEAAAAAAAAAAAPAAKAKAAALAAAAAAAAAAEAAAHDHHHAHAHLPAAVAALLPPLTDAARELAHRAATACLGVVFFLTGVPQLAETASAAAAGRLDTHVLMSLSAVGTALMGMPAEGALLLLLFRASHVLEDRLTAKAQGSLERLLDSVPQRATRVAVDPSTGAPEAATAAECPAREVSVGEHVLVRPGEAVPLDGRVVWGAASVSMQHISGESRASRASRGQEVPAGSLATDGLLVLRVTATSDDSTPARMARMAADAQAARPKLQRQLDAAGEVWTRAALAATVATAALLPLFFGVPFLGERGALYRAMGVLTAGSPCALAVVPLAYAAAIAAVASRGVLVRSGAALDALGRVSAVALDKTGTLTSGALSLAEGFLIDMGGVMEGGDGGGGGGAGANGTGVAGARRLTREALALAAGAAPAASASSPSSAPEELPLHVVAVRCAAALSSLSNHPISRAMAQAGSSGAAVDGKGQKPQQQQQRRPAEAAEEQQQDWEVDVAAFAQVPGSGVVGVCRVGASGHPVVVRFGALDWVCAESIDASAEAGAGAAANGSGGGGSSPSPARAALSAFAADQQSRPSRAVSFVTVQRVDLAAEGVSGSSAADVAAWWDGRARGGAATAAAAAAAAATATAVATATATAATAASMPSRRPLSPASAVAAGLPAVDPGFPAAVAMLCFEDAVQPGAREAVADLRSGRWAAVPPGASLLPSWVPRLGRAPVPLSVVMLTGDDGRVADAVAAAVGIDDVRSELRPEDKLAFVEAAREGAGRRAGGGGEDEGKGAARTATTTAPPGSLLMAGDGINDAPALAAADVGVAIASAPSDMVACAADYIVLNGRGVANLPWLLRVAARTRRVVAQNLALAVCSVCVSAVPAALGALPLWLAVSLHEGATLLVALNSLRVLLSRDSGPPPASASAAGGGVGGGGGGALPVVVVAGAAAAAAAAAGGPLDAGGGASVATTATIPAAVVA